MGTQTWPSQSSKSFADAKSHSLSEARRLNQSSLGIPAAERLFASAKAFDGNPQGFAEAFASFPDRADARFTQLAGAQPPPSSISLVYTEAHLRAAAAMAVSEVKSLADRRVDLAQLDDLLRHQADPTYLPELVRVQVDGLVKQRQSMRAMMAAVAVRIETSLIEASGNKALARKSYDAQFQGVYSAWDEVDKRMRMGAARGGDFTGVRGEPSTYDRIQARFDRLVHGVVHLNDQVMALQKAGQCLALAVSAIERPTIDGLLAAAKQCAMIVL